MGRARREQNRDICGSPFCLVHGKASVSRHRLAVGSALFLLLIAFLSLAAPMFEAARGLDGNQVNLFARFQLPSADAGWAGTNWAGMCFNGSCRGDRFHF